MDTNSNQDDVTAIKEYLDHIYKATKQLIYVDRSHNDDGHDDDGDDEIMVVTIDDDRRHDDGMSKNNFSVENYVDKIATNLLTACHLEILIIRCFSFTEIEYF